MCRRTGTLDEASQPYSSTDSQRSFNERRNYARTGKAYPRRGDAHKLPICGIARTTAKRDADWAGIVMLRAQGVRQSDSADQVPISTSCGNRRSQSFDLDGSAGLGGCSGRRQRRSTSVRALEKILTHTLLARANPITFQGHDLHAPARR